MTPQRDPYVFALIFIVCLSLIHKPLLYVTTLERQTTKHRNLAPAGTLPKLQ